MTSPKRPARAKKRAPQKSLKASEAKALIRDWPQAFEDADMANDARLIQIASWYIGTSKRPQNAFVDELAGRGRVTPRQYRAVLNIMRDELLEKAAAATEEPNATG